jgi:hypothetical protein
MPLLIASAILQYNFHSLIVVLWSGTITSKGSTGSAPTFPLKQTLIAADELSILLSGALQEYFGSKRCVMIVRLRYEWSYILNADGELPKDIIEKCNSYLGDQSHERP